MASPYIHTDRQYVERPWLGMAALIAVPLISLVLVRMFWSGSSLWFLAVGIILIGVAAIIFLARRTQDPAYGRSTLAQDESRLPLVVGALGAVFLAMLFLPNYSGDGSSAQSLPAPGQLSSNDLATDLQQINALPAAADVPGTDGQTSDVLGVTDPVGQSPIVGPPPAAADVVSGETYVVQDGDTLWDISVTYDVSVDAIVAANALADEADISIGQELVIPIGGDVGGAAE